MTLRAALACVLLSGLATGAAASPDEDLLNGLYNASKMRAALQAGANPNLLICRKEGTQVIIVAPEDCPAEPLPVIWAVVRDGYLIPPEKLAESIRLLAEYGANPSLRPIGADGKPSYYAQIGSMLAMPVLSKPEQRLAVAEAFWNAGYRMSKEEAEFAGAGQMCRNKYDAGRCDGVLAIFGRLDEGQAAEAKANARDAREKKEMDSRYAAQLQRLQPEGNVPQPVSGARGANPQRPVPILLQKPAETRLQAANRICGIMDLECRARILTGR